MVTIAPVQERIEHAQATDSTSTRVSAPDIVCAIERLDGWLQRNHYRAYDPFDGLNAWVRPLAVGSLGRQVLQQCVRRFPLNLRPVLGIHASESSKGYGYLARGYLKLWQVLGERVYLDQAVKCLDWLIAHASRNFGGMSWGNHFDYQSRVFYLPRGTPTIVWVAHIGQAFVDAWTVTKRRRYLSCARKACEFIVAGLERRAEGAGVCLSYVPGQYRAVHNANMLGAALLARVHVHTGDASLVKIARQAVEYTVGAQHADGSWWYGEAENLRWIDSFHTGYVLDSLWTYLCSTGNRRHAEAFRKGSEFFMNNFFLADGTPKYYADKVWPIDIQCAAQGIETLTLLSRALAEDRPLDLARKVAAWTIRHMQDEKGFFYFRKLPLVVNRTPTLHWGQATMLHALACLLQRELVVREGA